MSDLFRHDSSQLGVIHMQVTQVEGDIAVRRIDHDDGVMQRVGRFFNKVLKSLVRKVRSKEPLNDRCKRLVLEKDPLDGVVARKQINTHGKPHEVHGGTFV